MRPKDNIGERNMDNNGRIIVVAAIVMLLLSALVFILSGCAPTLAQRQAYLAEHPEIHPEIQKAIYNDYIITGMSQQDFLMVMGQPSKVNRFVSFLGAEEQWIYGQSYYYYFTDGKLTGWQEW
jgi:hypothetical protein